MYVCLYITVSWIMSSSSIHLWLFKANESRKVKKNKTIHVALVFKPVLSRCLLTFSALSHLLLDLWHTA